MVWRNKRELESKFYFHFESRWWFEEPSHLLLWVHFLSSGPSQQILKLPKPHKAPIPDLITTLSLFLIGEQTWRKPMRKPWGSVNRKMNHHTKRWRPLLKLLGLPYNVSKAKGLNQVSSTSTVLLKTTSTVICFSNAGDFIIITLLGMSRIYNHKP